MIRGKIILHPGRSHNNNNNNNNKKMLSINVHTNMEHYLYLLESVCILRNDSENYEIL